MRVRAMDALSTRLTHTAPRRRVGCLVVQPTRLDLAAQLVGGLQAESLGQPQGNQALAEDVLHGLAESEVDAERQRGDDLGQPDPLPVGR